MDLLEHSKDAYERELARRDELRRAMDLPLGVCVVIAGALFSLFRIFDWLCSSAWIIWCFGISWALCFIGLIGSVVYLVRSHIGYEYAYVPTSKEIVKYYENLFVYYANVKADGDVDQEVAGYLTGEYSNNAHHNALNNNSKSARLHAAHMCIVFSMIFLAISGAILLVSETVR